MPINKRTVRVIGPDHWPDSRAEDRAYWLSRPPAERVAQGRKFHAQMCRWFHLKGPSRAEARRMIKPRP